ncbi:hypothetical protein RCH10_002199 [Variovorax sp. GrIS 2.14]|uniref:DUF2242 domain-containing protein n=1 Tax=Variovorax sp. GrIS 2.14 TaxID=3071709 RepID=UPI0038F73AC3
MSTVFSSRAFVPFSAALAFAAALLLSGCGSAPKPVSYEPEEFDSTTTHTRSYSASEGQTCEAARRALLSQGYMLTASSTDLVTGRKSFQPTGEVHVEVELRVVCASEVAKGRRTVTFVTALQDRYALKKVNNSASVGVGAIGSLSLPYSSSDDAMVKIASETLTDEGFYDRFFALLERFLKAQQGNEPSVSPAALGSPEAMPAAPASPATAPPK